MTEIKPFFRAKYWVACDTESAKQVFFDVSVVLTQLEEFAYIAAFDETGQWIDEAKVIFPDGDDEPDLTFIF